MKPELPSQYDWHVQPDCQRPNRVPPERCVSVEFVLSLSSSFRTVLETFLTYRPHRVTVNLWKLWNLLISTQLPVPDLNLDRIPGSTADVSVFSFEVLSKRHSVSPSACVARTLLSAALVGFTDDNSQKAFRNLKIFLEVRGGFAAYNPSRSLSRNLRPIGRSRVVVPVSR